MKNETITLSNAFHSLDRAGVIAEVGPFSRSAAIHRAQVELRMRQSPSIITTDRLDRTIYLVLEDFSTGAAWRETDEDRTAYDVVINDLLTGQYEQPLRVVAFNPLGGWSRDASEDIAEELARRMDFQEQEVSEPLREFIENFTGRKVGAQLLLVLPLREFS